VTVLSDPIVSFSICDSVHPESGPKNSAENPYNLSLDKHGKPRVTYQSGAFSLLKEDPTPVADVKSNNEEDLHCIMDVLNCLQMVPSEEAKVCSTFWKGTILFIMRFDYVNLYQTTTDRRNTFFSVHGPTKDGTNILDSPNSGLAHKHCLFECTRRREP
jgi:hypothetical protein